MKADEARQLSIQSGGTNEYEKEYNWIIEVIKLNAKEGNRRIIRNRVSDIVRNILISDGYIVRYNEDFHYNEEPKTEIVW